MGRKKQNEAGSLLNGYPFSEESLKSGFVSDQRGFVPERIAVLRREILNQVQNDGKQEKAVIS